MPPGTYDVFVIHKAAAIGGNGSSADFAADKILVKRGVDLTSAATVDFDFANAVDASSVDDTIAGVGSDKVLELTDSFAGGTDAELAHRTAAPFTSPGLGSGGLATDVYAQSIAVTDNAVLGVMTSFVAKPAAMTYAAPAALGALTASVGSAAPYPQVDVTWPSYASAIGYEWKSVQAQTGAQCGSATACAVEWTAAISADAAASAPSFQVPDLSGLAGWSAKLQFVTGTEIDGTVTAETSSGGGSDFVREAVPPAGTMRTSSTRAWTVTP